MEPLGSGKFRSHDHLPCVRPCLQNADVGGGKSGSSTTSYLSSDISANVNRLSSPSPPQLPKSHGLNMPIYFVKPKEPTVLSHKEYHELSSTDLLLSWTVSPPLHITYPKATLTPGHGIGSERPRSSRDLGYRKVQRCTEQDVVKFSAHRGETSETGYTRHTLEGIPLFRSPSEPSYHGV